MELGGEAPRILERGFEMTLQTLYSGGKNPGSAPTEQRIEWAAGVAGEKDILPLPRIELRSFNWPLLWLNFTGLPRLIGQPCVASGTRTHDFFDRAVQTGSMTTGIGIRSSLQLNPNL
jgi:hypothetical protein